MQRSPNSRQGTHKGVQTNAAIPQGHGIPQTRKRMRFVPLTNPSPGAKRQMHPGKEFKVRTCAN